MNTLSSVELNIEMNTSSPGGLSTLSEADACLLIVNQSHRELASLAETPQGLAWLAALEDHDQSCMEELIQLWKSTPNLWAKGVVFGEILALQTLQQVTGRSSH